MAIARPAGCGAAATEGAFDHAIALLRADEAQKQWSVPRGSRATKRDCVPDRIRLRAESGASVAVVATWIGLARDGIALACRVFGGVGSPVLFLRGLAGHAEERGAHRPWTNLD